MLTDSLAASGKRGGQGCRCPTLPIDTRHRTPRCAAQIAVTPTPLQHGAALPPDNPELHAATGRLAQQPAAALAAELRALADGCAATGSATAIEVASAAASGFVSWSPGFSLRQFLLDMAKWALQVCELEFGKFGK